jgi:hypothetical protein
MKLLYFVAIVTLAMQVSACQYFTYTPRHRSQKQREKPSIFICERIVDFRREEGRWPASKEELMAKGKKYYDAFKGFRYYYTQFKTKDSNTMVFYFGEHMADEAWAAQTNKTDLNAYRGKVRFFKVKDKFAYKIKMD